MRSGLLRDTGRVLVGVGSAVRLGLRRLVGGLAARDDLADGVEDPAVAGTAERLPEIA
ncbi:hypothetical protein SANTM175S_06959 [Streptomyces antimycoticus]